MQKQFMDTVVNVRVCLGATTVSMGDLLNLNVGDVIPLEQDATGELSVEVEGVKKMKCYYGVSHGNVAVQVTKVAERRKDGASGG